MNGYPYNLGHGEAIKLPRHKRTSKVTNSIGKEIASTTLNQLGGNRFIAMTGAKGLSFGLDGTLRFKVGRNALNVNHVQVSLNGKDLYDMKFIAIRGAKITTKKEYSDVYGDQLQNLFTEATGMYTSL